MGVTAPHTRHRGTAARAAPSTPRRARLSPRSPRVRPLARTCVERPQALRVHRRVERPVPQHVLRRGAVVAACVAAAAARVLLVGLQAHAVHTAGKAGVRHRQRRGTRCTARGSARVSRAQTPTGASRPLGAAGMPARATRRAAALGSAAAHAAPGTARTIASCRLQAAARGLRAWRGRRGCLTLGRERERALAAGRCAARPLLRLVASALKR